MSLTISTRTLGKVKPLLGDFEVSPPDDLHDDGQLLLRQLIEHVVTSQVEAYNTRQESRRFDRILSAPRIESDAKKGKVSPEGRADITVADIDNAVGAALQAFEDGLYLVIIDDVERRSLDEPVYLSPSSRMVFVRLTFLAGA
ncbi:MAG: hypothetical protein R3B58_03335 [Phycisphaerales bacterium]|nr:hypothetical protein [Phycisphaerales bacterium]